MRCILSACSNLEVSVLLIKVAVLRRYCLVWCLLCISAVAMLVACVNVFCEYMMRMHGCPGIRSSSDMMMAWSSATLIHFCVVPSDWGNI